MIRHRKTRRGIILLMVLVVIAMLTLAALGFSELMMNERRAGIAASRQAQARSFALSGAALACQFLDRDLADQNTAGGIFDNSSRFQDQVVDDAQIEQDRGRFCLVAPKYDGVKVSGVRYGVQDESTKINLTTILNYDQSSGTAGANESLEGNTYSHIMLMGLPGMTDDVADAILEWIDPSGKQRTNGPGAQYYAGLSPPYTERNGPPLTIEELLLVKGVTPEALYGLDAAKMGLSSGSNSGGGSLSGIDNSDGSMDHGWAAYLTLSSAEDNLKSDGTQKINVNDPDLQTLYQNLANALDDQSAEFIVAYRLGGKGKADASGHLDLTQLSDSGSTSGGSASGGSASGGGATGSVQISNLLELASGTATLTVSASNNPAGPVNGPPTGPTNVPPTSPVNNPKNPNPVYLDWNQGSRFAVRDLPWEVHTAAIASPVRRPQMLTPSSPNQSWRVALANNYVNQLAMQRRWVSAGLIAQQPGGGNGGGRGGNGGGGNGGGGNGGGGRGGAGGGNGGGGNGGGGRGGAGGGGGGRGGEGGGGRGGAGGGGEGGGGRGGAGGGGNGGGGRGGAGGGGNGGGGRGGAGGGGNGGGGRGGAGGGGNGGGGRGGAGGGRGGRGGGRGGRGGGGRGGAGGGGRGGAGGAKSGAGGAKGGAAGGAAGGGARATNTAQAGKITLINPFSPQTGSMSTTLPNLFANCTTSANTSTAGRININQAPRVVLMCIPNMTTDLADQLVQQRQMDPTTQTETDQCPAWPLVRGMVDLPTMQKLLPYINTGGSVYRAQVIGSFEKGATAARIEVVIDATQSPSRIVFWNDISHLQGVFPVEPQPGDSSGGGSGNSAGNGGNVPTSAGNSSQ